MSNKKLQGGSVLAEAGKIMELNDFFCGEMKNKDKIQLILLRRR
jgi:hypothetical protein